MAKYFNKKVKERKFKVGDLVLREATLATKQPVDRKLGPNWEGPYRVMGFNQPGAYYLEDMQGRQLPHP